MINRSKSKHGEISKLLTYKAGFYSFMVYVIFTCFNVGIRVLSIPVFKKIPYISNDFIFWFCVGTFVFLVFMYKNDNQEGFSFYGSVKTVSVIVPISIIYLLQSEKLFTIHGILVIVITYIVLLLFLYFKLPK
ncbi:MAG: hypothetical protein MJA31_09990 [Clostridia bacterium]|nr:hypothetical protein [Clostridia bacterium]